MLLTNIQENSTSGLHPMEDLMKMPVWVCMRIECANGKKRKVPYDVFGQKTGTDASSQKTWVTYKEAVQAVKVQNFDGIGFVVPPGYMFLDIDHREKDDPLVQELLQRFHTYTEESFSGDGLHLYGRCQLDKLPTVIDKNTGKMTISDDFYKKNPHNHLELYIGGTTNRYAVYTGRAINHLAVADCTEAVITTLDKDMRKPQKKRAQSTQTEFQNEAAEIQQPTPTPEVDQVVLKLMRQKNAMKFCSLYISGDTHGYNSDSEADLALCSMIAFATGDCPELIDQVFRSSALYRPKWERSDYRDNTIKTALVQLQSSKKALAAEAKKEGTVVPPFIRVNEKGKPSVLPPLLAKFIRNTTDYILVRDSAKQGTLLYVYQDGVYKMFSQDMMLGLIKKPIMDYNEELLSMPQVREAYSQIITDSDYVQQDILNADEDVINFQNGLLHISASGLAMKDHTSEVYSTIQIPSVWKGYPEATPVFDAYMHTLTNGDKAVENLLMEFIGVCLSNIKGWRLKKSLFMVGDGNTGKSQLKSLVEKLLGKGNFIGMDMKEMEARFGTSALYQTRLAGSSDMSFITIEELKTFKKLTGGDSIFAEYKGQQGFEFVYNGLLWFCMNRLPKFGGDDGRWVYDRMLIVRCDNVIPPEKQDKLLLDKLYAERSGIIYKAVLALQRVISRGYRFSEPEVIKTEKQAYIIDNNSVLSFYEECMCKKGSPEAAEKHITASKVYEIYRLWCKSNTSKGYAKPAKEFRDTIAKNLGSTYPEITFHSNVGTEYRDITLTRDADSEYNST